MMTICRRLLQAEDERTLQGVLVLMNNALHESQSRRSVFTAKAVQLLQD